MARRPEPWRFPIDLGPSRGNRSKRSGFRAALRQLLYRKPFRIPPPALPVEFLAALEAEAKTPWPAPVAEASGFYRLIAEVATGLWRIRRKALPGGAEEPSEAMRSVSRHVEAVWDTLTSAKVEIRDHTKERYVTGMALKVIAFQPVSGVQAETILETIKPSVFFHDRLIQRGEVIVATPERTSAEPPMGGAPNTDVSASSPGGEARNDQSSAANQKSSTGDKEKQEGGW